MKKFVLIMVLGSLMNTALAQDTVQGGWYAGAGLTQVHASDAPEPKNYVLSLGYEFRSKIGIEYQYSGTYSEDTFYVDFIAPMYRNIRFDASIDTSALFATYVLGDSFYAKAKAGFMKAEYNADVTYDVDMLSTTTDFEMFDDEFAGEPGSSGYSATESRTGWAAGVSVGYKFTPHSAVELEYLTTADKIYLNFLNIGYKYSF